MLLPSHDDVGLTEDVDIYENYVLFLCKPGGSG